MPQTGILGLYGTCILLLAILKISGDKYFPISSILIEIPWNVIEHTLVARVECGSQQNLTTLVHETSNAETASKAKLKNVAFFVLQIAKHLVERGVAAGAVDSQGATPLHYAACNHNLAFCRFLWGK